MSARHPPALPTRCVVPLLSTVRERKLTRLLTSLGIIKTHRLTYSNSSMLYANASRAKCISTWSVSSKVLKEW